MIFLIWILGKITFYHLLITPVLGCILYELCCLKRAFEAPNLPALILKISKGNVQGAIPSHYSQTLARLIDWMLATDPNERPNITEVMTHHWVAPHIYKLPTSIGRLSCTTTAKDFAKYKPFLQLNFGNDRSSRYLISPKLSSCQTSIQGTRLPWKCIVRKESKKGVHILPLPEFEPHEIIVQICGKNIAITNYGSVIRWRAEKQKTDNQMKFVSLLYDDYFSKKGIKITYIASSDHFDCFITDRGILLTKGNGRYGCLGHGDRESVVEPKIVECFLGDEIKLISCSAHHVIAVNSNDSVFCWGQNITSCLGISYLGNAKEKKIYPLPMKLSLPGEESGVLDVFCSHGKSCLLMKDRKTIVYAGNFNFICDPDLAISGDGFRISKCNRDFLIQDISLTSTTEIILYEDGILKVSTSDPAQYDLNIALDFEKQLQTKSKLSPLEKPEKVISKEIICDSSGKHKICVAISTNYNNIFVCKDLLFFVSFISESTMGNPMRPQTKLDKAEGDRNNMIDVQWNLINRFFDKIPRLASEKVSPSVDDTFSFDYLKSHISILRFFRGDISEDDVSLIVAYTPNEI